MRQPVIIIIVIVIKMFNHHILELKMNYNVFTICKKITNLIGTGVNNMIWFNHSY